MITLDKSKARRDNKNQSIQNIVNHSQGDKDLVSNLEQVQVVNSKGNSKNQVISLINHNENNNYVNFYKKSKGNN